jgi:Trp operon repressor
MARTPEGRSLVIESQDNPAFELAQGTCPAPAAESLGDACPHCKRSYGEPEMLLEDERKEIRQEAIRDVLQFLAAENDVRRIGWRCALAHWLVCRGESQQQMATRLGVTGSAVSQSLKAFEARITQWLQGSHEP